MTDYLISNSAAVIGGIEDASVPGSFDPAHADHALRFADGDEAALTLPGINDLWIHADCYYDDFNLTLTGDGYFWTVSVPNVEIVMIDCTNGERTLDFAGTYNITPTTTGPKAEGIPDATRFTLDAHLETGATVAGNADDFRATFYIDGAILGQVISRCDYINGRGPVKFAFGGADFLDGNGRFFLSNVLVSDQDTRGRRFRILRPTGAGALATAVGGFAELGDGDPATFAYARAAGDGVTSTLTPGATPPGTIGRVRLVTWARNAVEAPDPALVVNRLRIGGTDYDAAPQAPAGMTVEALASEWVLNPATGLPWTWADLANLEIGFIGDS